MPLLQTFKNEVRIPENNDWVVFILIGCLFLYIFMMNVIEREANLKDFLLQKYYDASNNLPSWIITSLVTALSLSVLVSQYIPIVPKYVADFQPFGYQLNKIGYTLIIISLFYFIRTAFGFLFYQAIGDGKNGVFFILPPQNSTSFFQFY
ncbi:hypothetical protein [Chryseobacterium indoltheticum]|uniref:hypothetical protein n=1 Tax=Chryseobacterium indoltheticum TaxID=254 RepID=UPI003F497907